MEQGNLPQRYERSADRIDTRASYYTRQTKAGEIEAKKPKLRCTFIATCSSHVLNKEIREVAAAAMPAGHTQGDPRSEEP